MAKKPTANLACSCIFCNWKGTYADPNGDVQFFTISPGSAPKCCYACAYALGRQAKDELLRRTGLRGKVIA